MWVRQDVSGQQMGGKVTQDTEKERDLLEARVRKLTRQAAETSMELHDLTEELPGAYLRILEVARKTYDKHEELAQAKAELSRIKGLTN